MKTRIILAALCVAAVAALPGLSKAAGDDWILVRVSAGAEGASGFAITVHALGQTDGSNTLVFGYGIGTPEFSFVNVDNYGRDGIHVDTSSELGSQHVEVTPPDAAGAFEVGVGIGTGASLIPGASMGVIAFVTGGSFTTIDEPSITAATGSVTTSVTTGSGSRALALTDPSRSGPAVSAGSLGAGVADINESLVTGLVGAVAWLCEVCMGSWTAPDGRTQAWSASGNNLVAAGSWGASGILSFSGPDGAWNWAWSGITTAQGVTLNMPGSPIVAAYAPIGDDWTLFTT